jgi:hypothetical protein
MEEFKIPKKLINIRKTYVQKTGRAVRIEGILSFLLKKEKQN